MSYPVVRYSGAISQHIINTVKARYATVTSAINREFWNLQSEENHSLLVGSYGRGTAINTSDIDVLVELPQNEYSRYDILKGNGQSRLLQAVRSSILTTYPRSDVRADGQVVKIAFSDGIKFEILPAFRSNSYWVQSDLSYIYPDTNMGGNWKSTNPKSEQEAMKEKNSASNGLLFDTCKHFRRIRDSYFTSYHLSGIVIDSFIYTAMGNWHWTRGGETSSARQGDYERVLSEYLNQHSFPLSSWNLSAPGSAQTVDTASSMDCLRKVIRYITD